MSAKGIFVEGRQVRVASEKDYTVLLSRMGMKYLVTDDDEAIAIWSYASLEQDGRYKAAIAWPRTFAAPPSVAEVIELKKIAPRCVHTCTMPRKFVGRTEEAKALIQHIKSSGFGVKAALKGQNPAFEYSTISGAGKSTWGFHIESTLPAAFPDCIIFRVSLNFLGGTGGGSDGNVFEGKGKEEDLDLSLARVLFARGCLETVPENVNLACWPYPRTFTALHLLCQLARHGHDPNQRLLIYVHLDEAAFLGGKVAKWVINILLEYNMRPDRLGWVVPVITHTCPLDWELNKFPLKRLFLSPLTLDELRDAADWTSEANADRLLSCTGGHASSLKFLLDALPQQPNNEDKYAEGRKALFENRVVECIATIFKKLPKEDRLAVLEAILKQSHIETDANGNWPPLYAKLWTAGVLFCLVGPNGKYAIVSMPLPALLPCLSMCIPLPKYLDRDSAKFDPAQAYEVLVTLWAAIKYSTIRHFAGELANFKALKEEKESSAFAVFADRQQAKIDGAGKIQLKKHKGERRLFLIQTKRAESHQATQTKKEVMEVVAWALANTTDAFTLIFATDRISEGSGYQEDMLRALEEGRPQGLEDLPLSEEDVDKEDKEGCAVVYLDRENIYKAIPPGVLAI